MYKIQINRNQIPCKLEITINSKFFYLRCNYNSYDSRIYVDLLDENGELLASQEPIVFGNPMWMRYIFDDSGVLRNKFPAAFIIPNFKDGSIRKIEWSNIDEVEFHIQEVSL